MDLEKIAGVAAQDRVPHADRADGVFERFVGAADKPKGHIDGRTSRSACVPDGAGIDIGRRGIDRVVALRPGKREIRVFETAEGVYDHIQVRVNFGSRFSRKAVSASAWSAV